MRPLYVVAGQSNAGSLARSPAFVRLEGLHPEYALASYFEGATALSPTENNDWYPIEDGNPETGELYRGLLTFIDDLLSDSENHLAGIVWVQGEADSASQERADAYAELLSALHDGLRQRYGTDFQFVVQSLSSTTLASEDAAYWDVVRDAQLSSSSSLQNTIALDPDDLILPLGDTSLAFRDTIHYSFEFSDALLRSALSKFANSPLGDLAPKFDAVDSASTIIGTDLADYIRGLGDDDTLHGLGGNDLIYGDSGNDVIEGASGHDLLDGGSGVDTLIGGAGDDLYRVDDASDQIIESPNEGQDTVETRVSWVLGINLETLIASDDVDEGLVLGGNELDNTVRGGQGDDIITGNAGNDILLGHEGNNVLLGGQGDDILDSGTEASELQGGEGNDRFLVRNSDDLVIEDEGQGFDLISAFSSIRLRPGSEVERVNAHNVAGSLELIGNEFDNTLVANASDTVLFGGAGEDRLIGMAGDDLLAGETGADLIDSGEGNDTILSLVDSDVVDGGNGIDTLILPFERASIALTGSTDGSFNLFRKNEAYLANVTQVIDVERIVFTDAFIDVTKIELPANEAPIFTSVDSVTLAENTPDTGLMPVPIDPEGAAVALSIVDEGDGALFTLDDTGQLAFIAAPDFENAADGDGDNTYAVTLLASDGLNETRQTIAIAVTDTNEAPIFTSVNSVTLAENTPDTGLTPVPIDPEGAAVTLSIVDDGDGALFTLDDAGQLAFIAAPDFENAADGDGDNTYAVTLLASDGLNETRQTIAIAVTDTNPEITRSETGMIATRFESDAHDMFVWSSRKTVFNESGGVSNVYLHLDNGDSLDLSYRDDMSLSVWRLIDSDDSSTWAERTMKFDAERSLTERSEIRDNGDQIIISYDEAGSLSVKVIVDGSDSHVWDKRISTYNPDGHVSSTTTAFDNGDMDTFVFDEFGVLQSRVFEDGADDNPWHLKTVDYDQNGEILSQYFVYDDGSEFVIL